MTVLVVALVAIGGCTGSGDDGPTTTTSTVPPTSQLIAPEPDTSAARELVDALASRNPGEIEAAGAAALPGSDAARFAAHQAAARRALGPSTTQEVSAVANGSFELCDGTAACSSYGAFDFDPSSARLSSLSIDGVPLVGRVSSAGAVSLIDDVEARVDSAYLAVAGQLTLMVSVSNGADEPVRVFGFAAGLRPDGGGPVEADGAWGPEVIEPGITDQLLLAFEGDQLGGTLELVVLGQDGVERRFELDVPLS